MSEETIRNKRSLYTIEIKRKTYWQELKDKNFLVSKTPTGIKKSKDYGGGEEIAFDEKYQVQGVWTDVEGERTVIQQTVDDLDLPAVIKAINGL